MENIINIRKVRDKMKEKPKGQKIYMFFDGASSQLTEDQKKDVMQIIKSNIENTLLYIQSTL